MLHSAPLRSTPRSRTGAPLCVRSPWPCTCTEGALPGTIVAVMVGVLVTVAVADMLAVAVAETVVVDVCVVEGVCGTSSTRRARTAPVHK